MITYQAINLTNKKFQVGSTTDFPRRCKEHHKGKGDLEFQRSLRKNPENFYWVVSEDDGLEDRSEEQYYLDFYCGSMWCYNHNPSSEAPPSHLGTGGPTHHLYGKKWGESRRHALSLAIRGENNPFYGCKHTEDSKQKQRASQTGKKHGPRSEEARGKMSEAKKGRTGDLCPASKRCEVTFPDGCVKVFNSVAEASVDTGINRKTLSRWARDGSKPNRKGRDGYSSRYLGDI